MNISEENKRFFVLDIIRGLAVLLMVLAHSVYFFHNGTNPVILGLEKIGNTLAFTTFLIVSGASTYIAYLKNVDLIAVKRKRLLNRVFVLLFSYYTLAIIIESKAITSAEGLGGFKQFFDIIIFKNIPSYTQFIPPFIFFSLFVYFFPKFLQSISTSAIKSFLFSTYIYITGIAIGLLTFPGPLNFIKLNLVGDQGAFRFPLLYYAPIFILGTVWGCWLTCKQHQKNKEEISKFLSVVSLFGILSIIAVLLTSNKGLSVFSLRWPPSIPFLLIGTFFTFTLATILYWLKQLRSFPLVRDVFLLLGQNAYGVFWSHTLIISLFALSGGSKVGSTTIFILITILVLIISTALATFIPFNFKFTLTFHNKNHDEEDALLHSEPIYRMGDELYTDATRDIKKLKSFFFPKHTGDQTQERLIKKRHFLAGTIIVILFSLITLPSFSEEAQKIFSPQNSPDWYKDDFTYRSTLE
ncbi:MAG: acyltransferase, partial [Bacteroidetes bacterium]|nr:acyltransferase [Bacteroidota bacterium]